MSIWDTPVRKSRRRKNVRLTEKQLKKLKKEIDKKRKEAREGEMAPFAKQ